MSQHCRRCATLGRMYLPSHFREERLDVIQALVRRHSLATLVTMSSGTLTANHIPMLLDPLPAPYGTLRGHVARANPVWRQTDSDVAALAIFAGPEGYISPSWYETKNPTGKVVPTWNYAAVHASGRLEFFHDAERLRELVRTLTDAHEAEFEHPWSIDDAPAAYIDNLLSSIVGIEMRIERLEAKWKMSQNRTAADRLTVVAALEDLGSGDAAEMAAIIHAQRE
jgi:transcriptional regulator